MNIQKDVDIATTKDSVIPRHTVQNAVITMEDNLSSEHVDCKGNLFHMIIERCIIPNWYGSKVSVKISMIFQRKREFLLRDITTI